MTPRTHTLDLQTGRACAGDILSRTIFHNGRINAVVIGIGQGQDLSRRAAAKPAMLFFVKSEASVGLSDDVQAAHTGT